MLVMWLATLILLLISILGGFTIGRYSSLLPLLLTALLIELALCGGAFLTIGLLGAQLARSV